MTVLVAGCGAVTPRAEGPHVVPTNLASHAAVSQRCVTGEIRLNVRQLTRRPAAGEDRRRRDAQHKEIYALFLK